MATVRGTGMGVGKVLLVFVHIVTGSSVTTLVWLVGLINSTTADPRKTIGSALNFWPRSVPVAWWCMQVAWCQCCLSDRSPATLAWSTGAADN